MRVNRSGVITAGRAALIAGAICLMYCWMVGLAPSWVRAAQAYLIPYWSKKAGAYECQFQLGYKGLIDLAYRSEGVSTSGPA